MGFVGLCTGLIGDSFITTGLKLNLLANLVFVESAETVAFYT